MVGYTRSIERVGESILHDDFQGLYAFFRGIWEAPHSYVVLIARRCLNLNEIFMQVHEYQKGTVRNKARLISNNALLLYAGEIADYYDKWGRFPGILLSDDMIYHGRGIMTLLHSLEELVVSRLQSLRGEELSKAKRYDIHRDLAAAIEIRAYGVNRQPLLIDDLYAQNLTGATVRDTSELRRLSQSISTFIQHIGDPYTSYALSCFACLPPDVRPQGWSARWWKYRGAGQEVFFQTGGGLQACGRLLPTVRLRRKYDGHKRAGVTLTSLVIFGEISTEAIGRLCREVLAELSAHSFQRELRTVPYILEQTEPYYQKPRVQFLSMLLSAVALYRFFEDLTSPDAGDRAGFFSPEVRKDTEKVARNFACVRDIQDELSEIFEKRDLLERLETILYKGFRENAGSFLSRSPAWTEETGQDGIDETNRTAERLFYKAGMDSEEVAWQTVCSRRRFCPERPDRDMISLGRYMSELRGSGKGGVPEDRYACCMLSQMDNGLISMNIELSERLSEEGGSTEVQCVLKAGELATFVMPRYYHLFIPAMALVERNAGRLRLERLPAVSRFIESLPEEPPDFQDSGEGDDWQEERAVLQDLKRSGALFVERLYECGQSLGGWDINLVTADDWRDSGKGTYLSFVEHNRARRRAYLGLATAFLMRCEEDCARPQPAPLYL